MTKYLRSKINGLIFDYNPRLAALPEWEEISEQEAYPERFAPVDLTKRVVQVDLVIPEEITEAPALAPPALVAEASRPRGVFKSARMAGLKGKS